jgi:precorrin-6B C5,15-methyltransferase / cobalt-precorrin-6B C5,C15-methyltransferase
LRTLTPTRCWLSIVGIGEDGWDGLSVDAKRAIESADVLYGGSRHLAHIPAAINHVARVAWPSPMNLAVEEILQRHRRQRKVAVLASGDPMFHGVGVVLTRELLLEEFHIIPQVSAFSLACARLGWAGADTTLVSLVQRPDEELLRYLAPGQQLVIYSKDGRTPATVASLLTRSGYGASRLHVFENLGGTTERHVSEPASTWAIERSGNLNLVALTCTANTTVRSLSLAPGLPDDVFDTDGQFTKREVRAATLARLAPLPGQTLWDVGAGTGTIGIEWMRANPACSCISFEEREERAARIQTNARNLGVPTLKVIQGTAPVTFTGLEPPHAIFLGGGVSSDGLFEACWERLLSSGRLVANAVSLESEANLISWHKKHGGELARIQIARADLIGGTHVWRPMMPVTQWMVTKP